jgi:hypothetical protein
MAAQLTPLKAFKCSYDDCFHSFDTEREMKAHLKDKKRHPYYCGKDPGYERIQRGFVKCDFHGKTWDELVTHKVETMLPWIVGERRFDKPKKLNHIVCEFCGEDFESLSGREIHRKQVCRVMELSRITILILTDYERCIKPTSTSSAKATSSSVTRKETTTAKDAGPSLAVPVSLSATLKEVSVHTSSLWHSDRIVNTSAWSN